MKVKVVCISKDRERSLDDFTIGKIYEIVFTHDKPYWNKDNIDSNQGSYIVIDDTEMPCMISEDNMWKSFDTLRGNNLNELGI